MDGKNGFPRRLVLVRHGETDWNRRQIPQGHLDVPLNETGRLQASALAERLRYWSVDVVYSSDLSRAWQTALILGDALGLAPRPVVAWREMDLGAWCGLERAEIAEIFADELAALARGEDVPRGGGETRAQLQARVVAEFERLRGLHADQSVLVVSHGGALKALLGHLIGLDLAYIDRLSTRGNTGLSIVSFEEGLPRLMLLNDTSHWCGEQLETVPV